MKIVILIGTLLAPTSFGAQAQILKCIGKDGKIEFATSCPSGSKQQDTGVGSKPAAAPAAVQGDGKDKGAPKSLVDRDVDFRKRQTDQKDAEAKAAQTATETADRKRACDSAQSNLMALKNRQRMSRTDPKTGERVFYDEADYQRELPVTERLAAENCK